MQARASGEERWTLAALTCCKSNRCTGRRALRAWIRLRLRSPSARTCRLASTSVHGCVWPSVLTGIVRGFNSVPALHRTWWLRKHMHCGGWTDAKANTQIRLADARSPARTLEATNVFSSDENWNRYFGAGRSRFGRFLVTLHLDKPHLEIHLSSKGCF